MNNLNVRMKAHVTFIWNNNETLTLAADETARDKVMELKIKIDAWGQETLQETLKEQFNATSHFSTRRRSI